MTQRMLESLMVTYNNPSFSPRLISRNQVTWRSTPPPSTNKATNKSTKRKKKIMVKKLVKEKVKRVVLVKKMIKELRVMDSDGTQISENSKQKLEMITSVDGEASSGNKFVEVEVEKEIEEEVEEEIEVEKEVEIDVDDDDNQSAHETNDTYTKSSAASSTSPSESTAGSEKLHNYLIFAIILPDHPFSIELVQIITVLAPLFPRVQFIIGEYSEFSDIMNKYLVTNYPAVLLFKNGIFMNQYPLRLRGKALGSYHPWYREPLLLSDIVNRTAGSSRFVQSLIDRTVAVFLPILELAKTFEVIDQQRLDAWKTDLSQNEVFEWLDYLFTILSEWLQSLYKSTLDTVNGLFHKPVPVNRGSNMNEYSEIIEFANYLMLWTKYFPDRYPILPSYPATSPQNVLKHGYLDGLERRFRYLDQKAYYYVNMSRILGYYALPDVLSYDNMLKKDGFDDGVPLVEVDEKASNNSSTAKAKKERPKAVLIKATPWSRVSWSRILHGICAFAKETVLITLKETKVSVTSILFPRSHSSVESERVQIANDTNIFHHNASTVGDPNSTLYTDTTAETSHAAQSQLQSMKSRLLLSRIISILYETYKSNPDIVYMHNTVLAISYAIVFQWLDYVPLPYPNQEPFSTIGTASIATSSSRIGSDDLVYLGIGQILEAILYYLAGIYVMIRLGMKGKEIYYYGYRYFFFDIEQELN
jgi:hypothetical protein